MTFPLLPPCGQKESHTIKHICSKGQCDVRVFISSLTCREHEDGVFPQSSLLQSQSDVAHRLVHGRHHAGVRPAMGVLDETVRGLVVRWDLQR